MATKARGSQSTGITSSRGQNRPTTGGKAGAGDATGRAKLANPARTTMPPPPKSGTRMIPGTKRP